MGFGKYQFFSWTRKGIAAQIGEKDHLGAGVGAAKERQRVKIEVQLNDGLFEKQVSLLGPGDITGIAPSMIVRMEPLDGVADFEPNYLPYIEFYDDDFAWRYTPAAPNGQKLRPWLALAVLAEGEFVETKRRVPQPSIVVAGAAVLPPHDELHLWAHVHSNLVSSVPQTDTEKFLAQLEDDFNTDPDGLYSRLLCPRKLKPNTLYHAFLIPAFETGRLSGLGMPFSGVEAQKSAWNLDAVDLEMPFYKRWSFRTGINFDFEYAVRLLQPRKMPSELGLRPMDCSAPGFVQADKKLPVSGTNPSVLHMEGALKSPDSISDVFVPDKPISAKQAFFSEIELLVNLNKTQNQKPAEDPFVTIPYYGGEHAKLGGVMPDFKVAEPPNPLQQLSWLNELNRDPRWRAAAGLGVQIVQERQEQFMEQAWQQLQSIEEANLKLHQAEFAAKVTELLHNTSLATLDTTTLLSITRPVAARILDGNTTVFAKVRASNVPGAIFTHAYRRLTRATSGFQKHFPGYKTDTLRQKFAANKLSAAPQPTPTPLTGMGQQTELRFNLPATNTFFSWGADSNLSAKLRLTNENQGLGDLEETVDKIVIKSTDVSKMNSALQASGMIQRFNFTETVVAPPKLTLETVTLQKALNPRAAFIKKIEATILMPANTAPTATFDKVMAYPDLPQPVSKYLIAKGKDLLLPNLHLVPQNTLTLMLNNRKFIEAFLVGMNYEMGRELRWREYPTDQRGSYFRQFWDVNGLITPDATTAEMEKQKDITRIHTWAPTPLGSHKSAAGAGTPGKDTLILLIRGDLFRKYPNAVVYAQKAKKKPGNGGGGRQQAKPMELGSEIMFPAYKAEIKPDIKLLGFDLTEPVAKGDGTTGNPGWFFVIAEAPGEPKFGMDLDFQPSPPFAWDDLSWTNVQTSNGGFIRVADLTDTTTEEWSKLPKSSGQWGRSAADMATILFQLPAMIATHAKEMLT